jgi:hypothetical protein
MLLPMPVDPAAGVCVWVARLVLPAASGSPSVGAGVLVITLAPAADAIALENAPPPL